MSTNIGLLFFADGVGMQGVADGWVSSHLVAGFGDWSIMPPSRAYIVGSGGVASRARGQEPDQAREGGRVEIGEKIHFETIEPNQLETACFSLGPLDWGMDTTLFLLRSLERSVVYCVVYTRKAQGR